MKAFEKFCLNQYLNLNPCHYGVPPNCSIGISGQFFNTNSIFVKHNPYSPSIRVISRKFFPFLIDAFMSISIVVRSRALPPVTSSHDLYKSPFRFTSKTFAL